MRFLSICSGIEAASVAFHPLGWQALAFAEIEPFPCSLLAHHYPGVPNLGDLTRWREWNPDLLAQVDVLCGGTPCQAFSVAGLRGSLSDERGNLTLTFCHLFDEIDRIRHLHGRPPVVCLWENVPGVLNTDDNAFGHFLAGLAGEDVPLTPPGSRWTDAGYVRGPKRAVAWRILDAQYFGLAQRRERVFVVASADPAFDPAAVLFELDGLRRDTPPRRGPGEGAAHELAPSLTSTGRCVERPGESRGQDPVIAERMPNENQRWCQDVAPTLNAHFGDKWGLEDQHINGGAGLFTAEQVCAPLTGNAYADNASEESKLVPEVVGALPFDTTQITSKTNRSQPKAGDPCHPLAAGAHAPSIAFAIQERAVCENPKAGPGGVGVRADDCAYTLEARQVPQAVAFDPIVSPSPSLKVSPSGSHWRVRRLTPEECEMLQGFPIGYTLIPGTSSKKRKGEDLSDTIDYLISLGVTPAEAEVLAHSPDGPRYKALGNSWAVPVARWIARRIDACAKALSRQ